MRVDVVRAKELSSEESSLWGRIQQANADLASPYFCPEFTMVVGSVRNDVYVGMIEDSGRVVGFFPFQRAWTGTGRPVGGPLSDCQGVVIAPDADWDALDLIRGCRLRVWNFDHLLDSQKAFEPYHVGHAESPVMDLSKGFEAYRIGRPGAGSKRMGGLDALVSKLERDAGEVRFEAEVGDVAVLRTLLHWKSEQYRRSKGVDILGFRWIVQLLERIHATKNVGFAGVLSALYAGERIAAAHLGMRSQHVWHYWFPSYDRQFAKYSPGLILLTRMAEIAPSLGIRTIDLGKGDQDYKRRLMSRAVPLAAGRVEVSPLISALRRARLWGRKSVLGTPLEGAARIPARLLRRAGHWLRFR